MMVKVRKAKAELEKEARAKARIRPIFLRYWNKPLRTVHYVEHQLRAVGAEREIFTRPALQRLHEVSGSIPRHINHLATLALMAAVGTETRLVDEELVRALIETEWQGVAS